MTEKVIEPTGTKPLPICGIIMPISSIDDCSEAHWQDVREILSDAIEDAGFTAQMVNEAEDIGIIQKRIIQNIYSNSIVVCDVSAKNPNVMFELGMRLAFDKPTIIVKDDKTTYSFDTSPIEHLEYPRDLRFPKIVEFQEKLAEKIQGTHKSATSDSNYTTFLKHFGTFTVPVLETKEVSKEEYILEELRSLKSLLSLSRNPMPSEPPKGRIKRTLCIRNCSGELLELVLSKLRSTSCLPNPAPMMKDKGHYHISVADLNDDDKAMILNRVRKLHRDARLLPTSK